MRKIFIGCLSGRRRPVRSCRTLSCTGLCPAGAAFRNVETSPAPPPSGALRVRFFPLATKTRTHLAPPTNSKRPAPESLPMRGVSWNHLPVMGVCFRGFGATPGCRRVPESRRLRPWSPSRRAAGCPYGNRCTRRRSRGGPCGRSSTTSRCPRDAGSAD